MEFKYYIFFMSLLGLPAGNVFLIQQMPKHSNWIQLLTLNSQLSREEQTKHECTHFHSILYT